MKGTTDTLRYHSQTTLLLSAALVACHGGHGDLHSLPRQTSGKVILQESFDNNDDEFAQQWATDVAVTSKSTFSFADGYHGNGLRLTTTLPMERSVRVFRTLDATELRGMRLRLSAYARVTSHDQGREEIRISIPRPRGVSSAWDLASATASREGEWSPVATAIDVPADATSIEVSMVAIGSTDVTFDDLHLEASAAPANHIEPLRSDQRDWLVTLIQMIGYVRFFYPSDAAAGIDWSAMEIEAVDRMLSANTSIEAHRELAALLARIAPDAALYSEGSVPPAAGASITGTRLTRWVHLGLGGGDPYWSFRTGPEEPATVGMRLSVRKPFSEIGTCKRAVAAIILENIKDRPIVQLEVAPIMGGLRPAPAIVVVDARGSAEVNIPTDAYGVSFGVFLRGFGSVDISAIKLSCDGRPVAEIRTDSSVIVSGVANHLYKRTSDHRCGNHTCVHIERQAETEIASNDILDESIGQGIRLQMSVVAWTDGIHTIPQQRTPSVGIQVPASSRASRLAAALDLWIMLRWFYPYFADEGIDWKATIGPALDEAAKASSSDAQRHALSRLTFALRDDHARVLRPDIDDGLLPLLFQSVDDKIIVTAALSPSIGIPIGSTLVAIDGVPVGEARRRAIELISAATPAFELRHSTYSLGYGRRGTFARVTLREPGGTRDVTRVVPRLDRSELVAKLRETRPTTGTVLAEGIVYVDLHTLDDATWTSVLPKLLTSNAVIFDLRGYVGPAAFAPLGHLTDRETRSPTFLVPRVAPGEKPQYEEIITYRPPRKPRLHAKAIFLADARTASAPETILQIVHGEGLGIIIGEPTGGTNGNVIEYTTIGGMSMRFTGMRVLNHDGTVFQGHGIKPDVIVHPTVAGIVAGRDEILEAAVKLAANPSAP